MKIRSLIILLTVLSLSILYAIQCSPKIQMQETIDERTKTFTSIDSTLNRAITLCSEGDYGKAGAILKSIGQRGYSYYRTDELLYWLGQCNIGLKKPEKAQRCFKLLRMYYSRCEVQFPDLSLWEKKADELYEQLLEINDEKEPIQETLLAQKNASPNNSEPRVSNVFYETEIRQALADIAAETGVDIIADPTISGYISAELKDVPLDQALERLLSPLGFMFKKMDGYYLVSKVSAESPSFNLLAETQKVDLRYLKVSELKNLLPKYYLKYLNIDEKANSLTISAPPQIIKGFLKELTIIDTPPLQFMIEATVVEMGKETRSMLGLDWDWTGTKDNNDLRISKLAPVSLDSSFITELIKQGGNLWGSTFDLKVALRALAIAGKAQIKANPRITTQQSREAVIHIGTEAYYSLIRGPVNYPYITLEKISTGITLKITPYMGSYGDITNEISVEVSDVTGAGVDNLPVTSVRSVQTKVTVANGTTFGLGGLVVEYLKQDDNRVPFLGKIPIIRWFFGSTEVSTEATEVVILITPHVLIDPREFDVL